MYNKEQVLTINPMEDIEIEISTGNCDIKDVIILGHVYIYIYQDIKIKSTYFCEN